MIRRLARDFNVFEPGSSEVGSGAFFRGAR